MTPAVELRQVEVRRSGRTVLRDLNLSITEREFVGIVGPNGAGKTTLLNLILGMLRPTRGEVTVQGRVRGRGDCSTGYVPQHTDLDPDLPLRARDFVGLGFDGNRWGISLSSRRRDAAVAQALAAVDALAYADARVGHLSGGEQQRLFIAQALVSSPRLLLLDEPFSNLDLHGTADVVDVLARLRHQLGVTVLVVTHDVNSIIDVADRIIYLAAGRAAVGTTGEVLRTDVLSTLFGYRVNVVRVGRRVVVVPEDGMGGELAG